MAWKGQLHKFFVILGRKEDECRPYGRLQTLESAKKSQKRICLLRKQRQAGFNPAIERGSGPQLYE